MDLIWLPVVHQRAIVCSIPTTRLFARPIPVFLRSTKRTSVWFPNLHQSFFRLVSEPTKTAWVSKIGFPFGFGDSRLFQAMVSTNEFQSGSFRLPFKESMSIESCLPTQLGPFSPPVTSGEPGV